MDEIKLKKTVKIGDKSFTVCELTVQEIITLINEASFFKDKEEDGVEKTEIQDISEDLVVNRILANLDGFDLVKKDLEKILEKCCDFTIQDLIPLPPSKIKEIVLAFKEVNADFLSVLASLKIPEVIKDLWHNYVTAFLERLAT